VAEVTSDEEAAPRATVEHVSDDAGVATFRVGGQIDVSTEGVLRAALMPALTAGTSKIVLDVSNLDFMDSSGLAVLLVAARDVPLELHEPTDVIRRLVTIAGLSETLRMTPDA
jgi:anti-sigma B factor antagonist